MIKFEFLIRRNEEPHTHADIELFYVMEGQLVLTMEDKKYHLNKDHFLVINADKKHSYQAADELLAVSMHISYAELSEILKQNMIFFWCNTTLENNETYDALRRIIKKIISEQYHKKGSNVIYMNSLYYEFLHVLTHDFLLTREKRNNLTKEHKFEDRKQKISEYIRLNYDKQISLNDLSRKLFLSNAYLSKYIKRQFGMSFVDYVNSVRLNYAVSQLLYSDKSVVRIAMDTGFASSAALNKAFKEKYNMTPTAYRGQWNNSEMKGQNTVEEEKKIQKQVAKYFQYNKEEKQQGSKYVKETAVLFADNKRLLEKNWNKMINIGTFADLLHSDMQKHVLQLKSKLQFKYIRVWDIYSSEIFLDAHKMEKQYNFTKLDRVLDFLILNDLIPYIELGIKPKKVIRNWKEVLIDKEIELLFPDDDTIRYFLSSLMIHLINRYGGEKVEQWYFELWMPEPEIEGIGEAQSECVPANISPYLRKFDLVAGTLRHYFPTIKIGGGGLSLRHGENLFRSVLAEWKNYDNKPDFLSVYSFPYSMDSIIKQKNQSADVNFLKNNLERIHELMKETDFSVKELHVSEWSFSVSNRNILNDSCMKGAYLVKHMIDSIGYADILGHWVGSDLYADYYDSKLLLNGSSGLLSKDEIPKPAYFAFDFMNRLGRYIRGSGQNYIITDNGHGNWRIVCHNLKSLNYQYGIRQESEVTLYEQNHLFDDNRKAKIHFNLPVQRDGTFQLRIYSVNQKHSSVQDEWIAMSAAEELNAEDIAYLKRIVIPRMVILNVDSEKGRLIFDAILEPNAIQFIHVLYQYV